MSILYDPFYWFLAAVIGVPTVWAVLYRCRKWFISKRSLIAANLRLTEDAERAKWTSERERDEFNRWKAESEMAKENAELRRALRLAEEDNDGLYRILTRLRTERPAQP